jgi:hypothetical protein
VPEYYREFTRQADDVADRLRAVGEPEVLSAPPSGGIVQRAEETTAAFAGAAHRHRHQDEAADIGKQGRL